MNRARTSFENIDQYIAASPAAVRPILQKLRLTTRQAAPMAREAISYQMPALELNGTLVNFAAFKNHIGLYPPVRGDARLLRAVAKYAGKKGSLRFPLGEPLPYELIARIVKYRVAQNAGKRLPPIKRVSSPADDADPQIRGFLRKYTPAIAKQLREARRLLRAHFPRGFELVYDNYNALAIGIGPTERGSTAILSVAGYPNWVTFFFLHGAALHDPTRLLAGAGARVRSLRLKQPQDMNSAAAKVLIAQALRPHAAALRAAPKLTTIVKSVSAKQRPRRSSAK